MDKDRNDSHARCSWMDMNQFIGDLITTGGALDQPRKSQLDVVNLTWGVAGREAPRFKGTLFEFRPRLGKSQQEAEGEMDLVVAHKKTKDNPGHDLHHACACPGCPFSSSSFETLKPQQSSPLPQPDAKCLPKDLSSTSSCLPDSTDNTKPSSSTSELNIDEKQKHSEARIPQIHDSPLPKPSFPQTSILPCVCCQQSIQTCQHASTSDLALSHSHPHFHHHHHCSVTPCLPCPQIGHPLAPQITGTCPCFSCQRPSPASVQACPHQPQKQIQQEDQKSTTSKTPLLTTHPCMHCPASFSRPSQLLQHQRSEHPDKPCGFFCTECGRTFNSHSNLRIHLNVHTGARPYSCSDCGKSFSQSGALKIHRRIHTGERPYSCGFCGRGFPHLAGVRAHQRTHTGEKPYRCGQCGKCFTQSGALKIHTRIHTGERPFTCRICEKGFSNRSGIRFHYRTVHGLIPENPEEGSAGRGSHLGRPRTVSCPNVQINTSNSSNMNCSKIIMPQPVSAQSNESDIKPQAEGRNSADHRAALLYTCEDCGLRFKDAPSRNRHQALVHYFSDGRLSEAMSKDITNDSPL